MSSSTRSPTSGAPLELSTSSCGRMGDGQGWCEDESMANSRDAGHGARLALGWACHLRKKVCRAEECIPHVRPLEEGQALPRALLRDHQALEEGEGLQVQRRVEGGAPQILCKQMREHRVRAREERLWRRELVLSEAGGREGPERQVAAEVD